MRDEREKSQPLAMCFTTRYQYEKLYVDLAAEATTDLCC
jgi:hypothetical protein